MDKEQSTNSGINVPTVAREPAATKHLTKWRRWYELTGLAIAVIFLASGSTYATWRMTSAETQSQLDQLTERVWAEPEEHGKYDGEGTEFELSECNGDFSFVRGRDADLISDPKCIRSADRGYLISVPSDWIQSVQDDSGGIDLFVGHPDARIRVEVSSQPFRTASGETHLVELKNGKPATVSVARTPLGVEFALVVLSRTQSYAFRAKVTDDFFEKNHKLIFAVAQTLTVQD